MLTDPIVYNFIPSSAHGAKLHEMMHKRDSLLGIVCDMDTLMADYHSLPQHDLGDLLTLQITFNNLQSAILLGRCWKISNMWAKSIFDDRTRAQSSITK
jgi:hypothetical protein